MLDCGLDLSTALNYLPLTLVQTGGEGRLNQLTSFTFKDEKDVTVEGVSETTKTLCLLTCTH